MTSIAIVTGASSGLGAELVRLLAEGAFGPLDPSAGPSVLTDIWNVTIAQVAPIMPYLLLVIILIVRPMGLMGTRES